MKVEPIRNLKHIDAIRKTLTKEINQYFISACYAILRRRTLSKALNVVNLKTNQSCCNDTIENFQICNTSPFDQSTSNKLTKNLKLNASRILYYSSDHITVNRGYIREQFCTYIMDSQT